MTPAYYNAVNYDGQIPLHALDQYQWWDLAETIPKTDKHRPLQTGLAPWRARVSRPCRIDNHDRNHKK